MYFCAYQKRRESEEMEKKQKMYFNRAQLEAMIIGAKNEYIIGGRGLGKSEGFDARVLVRNIFAMPKSTGALLSPSYAKLKTQTFPAIANALGRWGYRDGLHYYVGRKPPESANFPRPIIQPFEWQNVIAFFTGAIIHMISFDRPMSTNSMSLDYVIGPEARFLSFDKLANEVTPAIRGNRQYFGDCPWHGGSFFSTDMPTGSRGVWLFKKEEEMDAELILTIKRLYFAMQEYQKAGQQQRAAEMRQLLNRARREATFFKIYSALDNLELLGEEWFAKQARDLPPIVFQTAILSQRINNTTNAFYPSFDAERLCYTAPATTYAVDAQFTEKNIEQDCRWDSDIDPTRPLEIAFDYNVSINTMVVGQRIGDELRTLRAMFVKEPLSLGHLVEQFTRYYAYHPVREVVYYYDSTSVARAASVGYSYADLVQKKLTEGGFIVTPIYINRPIAHQLKFSYINSSFRGEGEYLRTRFNSEGCDCLITAIERTGSVINRWGFGKDKHPEKLPDTPEFPNEYKTHITDAWDTLFIGANLYPPDNAGQGVGAYFV